MPRPPKYKDNDERNAARKLQKLKYAQSTRGKAARSAQNHAAYKRRNGRLGSETTPYISPVVPRMAKKPIRDSQPFRIAFNQPELYASTPLTWNGLFSSYSQPTFSLGNLDLLHGLYYRIEQDSRNARVERFKGGDRFYLRKSINEEMSAAVRRWNQLWKKLSSIEDTEYDCAVDDVHFFWTSRLIEHLREELFLLSTTNRARDYISSVESRMVDVAE